MPSCFLFQGWVEFHHGFVDWCANVDGFFKNDVAGLFARLGGAARLAQHTADVKARTAAAARRVSSLEWRCAPGTHDTALAFCVWDETPLEVT